MLKILKFPPNSQSNDELAEIRQSMGMGGQILYFHLRATSFLNWLFRENDVLKFNKIFNSEEDNLFTVNENRVEILKNKWEFEDYQDYFDNIVVAHFCGPNKPWYYRAIPKSEIYKMDLHIQYRNLQRECTQLRINNNVELE